MSKLAEEKKKTFKKKFPNIHLVKNWSWQECDCEPGDGGVCTCQETIQSWLSTTFQEIEQARDEEILKEIALSGDGELGYDFDEAISEKVLELVTTRLKKHGSTYLEIIKSLSKQ